MEKEKIIDKLNFYIDFLDSFVERGDYILREHDWKNLKMTREWMLEAIKKLRGE